MLQALLVVWIAMLLYEVVNAWGAPPCGINPTLGCYPWRVVESPMESGAWTYSNWQVYTRSAMIEVGVATTAIAVPFLASTAIAGLVWSILLLVAGNVILVRPEFLL